MEQDINQIILNNKAIQNQMLSEQTDLMIQKLNNISIPSFIYEYISPDNLDFELDDLKQFYNHFGEVLNIVIKGKQNIVLFKTFFSAIVCKTFLENKENYKDKNNKNFIVRWFDFEKDSNILPPESKSLFQSIYDKNIMNIKQNLINNNGINNLNANNMGMNMNLNMQMNNLNLNGNINPMTQNQNIMELNPNFQYLQNNIMIPMNNLNNFPQGIGVNPNFNQINSIQNNINQIPSIIMNQNVPNINNLNNLNNFNNLTNLGIMNNVNNINSLNNINGLNNLNNLNNINNVPNINNIGNINNIPNINNLNNLNNLNNINNVLISQNNQLNQNINEEKNSGKFTCKYEILIENDPEFQIARRLIGSKGCNMKKIINECKPLGDGEGVKLRLRGRGSGYKEGPLNKESDDPLHLCISSKNTEEMKKACLLVDELLKKIYEDYKIFCEKNKIIPACNEIATRIENKNPIYKIK